MKQYVKKEKVEVHYGTDGKDGEDNENQNECIKCQATFFSRDNLKYHINTRHPKKLSCKECDETFNENWKLERHMTSHGRQKKLKCDTCEMTFHFKWRLNKHITGHQNQLKKCHYFNNNKTCPFEEIGCKFLQVMSTECTFKAFCTNDKCQFRH